MKYTYLEEAWNLIRAFPAEYKGYNILAASALMRSVKQYSPTRSQKTRASLWAEKLKKEEKQRKESRP